MIDQPLQAMRRNDKCNGRLSIKLRDVSIPDVLRQIAFFQSLRDEHLERLSAIASIVEFPKSTVIFRELQYAHAVYVIINGKVSLLQCRSDVGSRKLSTVGPGELVGWSPIVEPARFYSATACATDATKVAMFDGQQLNNLLWSDPSLGIEFLSWVAQILADRLYATRAQLMDQRGLSLSKIAMRSKSSASA